MKMLECTAKLKQIKMNVSQYCNRAKYIHFSQVIYLAVQLHRLSTIGNNVS